MFIPVNEPIISGQAKKNVEEAMNTGWLSSAGPFVKKFEQEFADYLGMEYAVSVCNGTAALHVALLALGVGKGDEVIVPAFTMAATWLSVLYVGAKPVFVDCDPVTFNIDPEKIESRITEKTRAVMPVHIYGQACEMDRIMELAEKYRLMVIEDAAEAHGAEYKNRKCGTFGQAGCFSFYANKLITTGEGGMIVTNDKNIYEEASAYKDLYHSKEKRFIHEKIGYNYRMTNLQAAVGCGELENIEKYIGIKKRVARQYDEGLKNIPGIRIPQTLSYNKNIYWMYGILVDKDEFGMGKDELRAELRELGIDTRDFFYSPSSQPVLKEYLDEENFPNCEFLSENGLYLPSGLAITDEQISHVIASLTNINKNT